MKKIIKIPDEFIPLDKSWIIRMGVLDMIHGYKDIQNFLNEQSNLGDDLLALKRITKNWSSNKPLDVGESGTLYRLLKFVSWKLNLNKKFITHGTLTKRKIADDSEIINYPIGKLLKLDNGTSQWATASILCGSKKRVKNPPYKLQLTYEAVAHWNRQRQKNKTWIARRDETILRQARVFTNLINRRRTSFKPMQPEDYCFARVFGYITKNEGEKRWPSLKNHESNRISEMEMVINQANTGKRIDSRDHRVIQAIAMWAKVKSIKIKIKYQNSVNKSWPQFWNFLKRSEMDRD